MAAALVLGVSACSTGSDWIAAQAKAGDRKGFVSGDGSVQRIAMPKRDTPIEVKGTTLDGRSWDSTRVRGQVVVLNVWGSWCGPCVAEAPHLQKVWSLMSSKGKPVVFMGLDFKEGPESGAAFIRANKITYPSLAYDGGEPVLALRGQAPTVPTTLLLDRSGRIAARVLGPVSEATLTGLIQDVLAEPAQGE